MAEKDRQEQSGDGSELPNVWTLQTWLPGDPPEGYGYGYPTQESAERNGREFQHGGKEAVRWQVVSPFGVITAKWEAS